MQDTLRDHTLSWQLIKSPCLYFASVLCSPCERWRCPFFGVFPYTIGVPRLFPLGVGLYWSKLSSLTFLDWSFSGIACRTSWLLPIQAMMLCKMKASFLAKITKVINNLYCFLHRWWAFQAVIHIEMYMNSVNHFIRKAALVVIWSLHQSVASTAGRWHCSKYVYSHTVFCSFPLGHEESLCLPLPLWLSKTWILHQT